MFRTICHSIRVTYISLESLNCKVDLVIVVSMLLLLKNINLRVLVQWAVGNAHMYTNCNIVKVSYSGSILQRLVVTDLKI